MQNTSYTWIFKKAFDKIPQQYERNRVAKTSVIQAVGLKLVKL